MREGKQVRRKKEKKESKREKKRRKVLTTHLYFHSNNNRVELPVQLLEHDELLQRETTQPGERKRARERESY